MGSITPNRIASPTQSECQDNSAQRWVWNGGPCTCHPVSPAIPRSCRAPALSSPLGCLQPPPVLLALTRSPGAPLDPGGPSLPVRPWGEAGLEGSHGRR